MLLVTSNLLLFTYIYTYDNQVDETFILLDCGWDETFDLAYIEAVKARVPQINAVLLSYADISHIGALPYLVSKCGLNAPVYATVSLFKLLIFVY